MRLSQRAAALFLLITAVCLLAFYVSQNLTKIMGSTEKLAAIIHGNPAKKMEIWLNDKSMASFDLPTSDLFDRSGQRQINFHYLSQEQLNAFTQQIAQSRILLNGQPVKDVILKKHAHNALSIILPEKHVMLVAPPHMQTAVRLLQQEKINTEDIFFCNAPASFCRSVALVDTAGLTDIKMPNLKEDSFFDGMVAPKGRFMGRSITLKFSSADKQTILLRLHLGLPFEDIQEIKVLVQGSGPTDPKFHFEKSESKEFFKSAVLHVLLSLEKGSTTLSVKLSKLLKAHPAIPYDTTGILKRLEYEPASKNES